MRIVIELDVTEQDVVIRVNREGQTAVVKSVGPAATSAGQAFATPAQDGGTTDAGPAPEINEE
ncbi:hypothetical protein GCM10010178_55190 [Lentzea flava]|uniref:Uncharacterized protein n=1 Tax=Lentzea flava TaxID=103732 RepID=A0ABQ2UY88_9PSEU|nr:hypothetical protein [Lentzea flava]GGU55647.1 hypothetical protein GCM10010178_55190 [Lentzea flava]